MVLHGGPKNSRNKLGCIRVDYNALKSKSQNMMKRGEGEYMGVLKLNLERDRIRFESMESVP